MSEMSLRLLRAFVYFPVASSSTTHFKSLNKSELFAGVEKALWAVAVCVVAPDN